MRINSGLLCETRRMCLAGFKSRTINNPPTYLAVYHGNVHAGGRFLQGCSFKPASDVLGEVLQTFALIRPSIRSHQGFAIRL